jgi:hypothetical protein
MYNIYKMTSEDECEKIDSNQLGTKRLQKQKLDCHGGIMGSITSCRTISLSSHCTPTKREGDNSKFSDIKDQLKSIKHKNS